MPLRNLDLEKSSREAAKVQCRSLPHMAVEGRRSGAERRRPKQREDAAFVLSQDWTNGSNRSGAGHGPNFRMFEMFESHVIIFLGALVLTCCKCWLSCTHCYITHSWRFMYWYLYNAIMCLKKRCLYFSVPGVCFTSPLRNRKVYFLQQVTLARFILFHQGNLSIII